MKRIILMLTILVSLFTVQAQQINIVGTVLDSTEIPIPGASIILVTEVEEELESFGITDLDGTFEIFTSTPGDYILKITIIGYGTFARKLKLQSGQNINLDKIRLSTKTYALDGLTIEDRFIPIVITKDTITYAADAFRTEANATVEDLLKKLPGIEVADDGTITAQGEEVQKILVDGKEFFEDDPKIASQNIPADVVDKVQVFDKQSEFTEFTGIEDGEEVKAINLKIKAGKNKGWFGNAAGEYGVDNRYNAGGNINRFNKKMQLSFIGNSNNINEMPFTIMDYLKFTDGFSDVMNGGFDRSELPTNILNRNGVNTTHSAGLNFNYDFSSKTTLRSNYFFNYSDNLTLTNSTSDNLLNQRSFINTNDAEDESTLGSHRVSIKLNHTIDTTQDINFKFQGSLTNTSTLNQQMAESSSNDTILNNSLTTNDSESDQDGWAADIAWRKRLKKKGRFLTADASFSQGYTGIDALYFNESLFSGLPSFLVTTNQIQTTNSDELGYGLEINYVEPIGVGMYLNFELSRINSINDRLKLFVDELDPFTQVVNTTISSNFTRALNRTTFGTKFKQVKPKYNYSIGADLQRIDLENDDLFTSELFFQDYINVLPNARLKYSIGTGAEFSLNYRTSINIPTIEQLQPTIDNSDPLNIYQGNPNLIPEYTQSLNLRYRSFNQFYFRSFFAGISARYATNTITDSEIINEELVSVRTPVNSQAEWQTSAYYNFGTPFRGKNIQIRIDGNLLFLKTNVLLNDQLDRTLFTTFSQRFTLENQKKKVMDLSGTIRVADNFTSYQLNSAQNQNFFDFSLIGDLRFTFLKNWNFQIDAEYQRYLETDFVPSREFVFLNAKFSRYLLEKQLIIHIRGANLFDEQAGISYQSAGNQNTQTTSNRIGRLVMLGLSYKIRSFGK